MKKRTPGWTPTANQPSSSGDPRLLLVSQRTRQPQLWRSFSYEFEDLIADFEGADLVAPTTALSTPQWKHRLTRVLERASNGNLTLPTSPVELRHEYYDLIFINCQLPSDLLYLGSMKHWTNRTGICVCYIVEMWDSKQALRRDILDRLRCFDIIFVGLEGTVDMLRKATGRPCYYLPPAVDVLSFCPYPNSPKRVVDVFSMGRRSENTHQSLKQLRDTHQDFFYIHDTQDLQATTKVTNHQDHRRQLMQLIKRTKYFIANRAKIDRSDQTKGQEEVGLRYYEGIAGGAVIIGDPPESDVYNKQLGWEDSSIFLPYDSAEIARVIETLEADPQRVTAIRKRNVINALRQHDYAHRWTSVLDKINYSRPPALQARLARLDARARMIEGKSLHVHHSTHLKHMTNDTLSTAKQHVEHLQTTLSPIQRKTRKHNRNNR